MIILQETEHGQLQAMKMCSQCKVLRPISEFRKNSKSSDRYRSYCKIHSKRYDNSRPPGTKSGSKVRKANIELRKAIKDGLIVRPEICERCGALVGQKNILAHHYDYEKGLDVLFLCRSCHKETHDFLKLIEKMVCGASSDKVLSVEGKEVTASISWSMQSK